MRRVLLLLCLVALLGCGDDADPTGGDAGEPGGSADGLFLEVTVSGGLVPPGLDERNLPMVVLYEDGTAFAPGAVPAIFPGPAVDPVMTGRVPEATLDELVRLAADGGLLGGDVDLDLPAGEMITDAPTTVVRLVVDGREHRLSAYALGLVPRETAPRTELVRLVQQATDAATFAATEPYDPDGYEVHPIGVGRPEDEGLANTLDWPAGVPEPTPETCTAVTGDAATALDAVLTQATQITRWRLADGTETVLAFRPVLPHETPC